MKKTVEALTCKVEMTQNILRSLAGFTEKVTADVISAFTDVDPLMLALQGRVAMTCYAGQKDVLSVDGIPLLILGPLQVTSELEDDVFKIVATRSVERVKHG